VTISVDEYRKSTVLEKVEVLAGVVLVVVVALTAAAAFVWCVSRTIAAQPNQTPLLFVALWVAMSVAEIATVGLFIRGWMTNESPILVKIANLQPRWSNLFSAPVAVWWGWHFLVMLVGAEMMFDLGIAPRAGLLPVMALDLFRIVWIFAASVASNGFLLLALHALSRGGLVVRRAYDARFAVDLACAAVVPFLPWQFTFLFRVWFVFLFRTVFHWSVPLH
jgi:hypothetical protein